MEQRELLFRAWDQDFGQMIYDFSEGYHVSINYGKLIIGSTDGNGDYFELPVTQWTGLLDSKGVKIFEGDIVDLIGGSDDYVFSGWGPYAQSEVKFHKGAFVIVDDSLYSDPISIQQWLEELGPKAEMAVIGNVFETSFDLPTPNAEDRS